MDVSRAEASVPTERVLLGRRQFLIATGVLGAVAVASGGSPATFASLLSSAPTATLAPVLATLALDTMSGLVAFVMPGTDAFSVAQGVKGAGSGGVAADGEGFMVSSLDDFLPLPQELIRPLVAALATSLGDEGLPTGGLLGGVLSISQQIDAALAPILKGQGTAPLSLPIAMLLNAIATDVDPLAVVGPYLDSPFANLSSANKGLVFQRLEEDTTAVAAMLDSGLPQPLSDSLSGVIAFVAGSLLEFAAFGSFNEWHNTNATTRKVTSVPVGWRNSQYLTTTSFTPVDGWNDLQGYFQGRTKASD